MTNSTTSNDTSTIINLTAGTSADENTKGKGGENLLISSGPLGGDGGGGISGSANTNGSPGGDGSNAIATTFQLNEGGTKYTINTGGGGGGGCYGNPTGSEEDGTYQANPGANGGVGGNHCGASGRDDTTSAPDGNNSSSNLIITNIDGYDAHTCNLTNSPGPFYQGGGGGAGGGYIWANGGNVNANPPTSQGIMVGSGGTGSPGFVLIVWNSSLSN